MGETCCLYRRKLVIGLLAVLPEEECGVKDSEVADLIDFDLQAPSGKPVIRVRFCPWCGKPWDGKSEQRIVDIKGVS